VNGIQRRPALHLLPPRRRCRLRPCRFGSATAFGFHLNLADKAERTLFIKDLAIAGALMVIAAQAWPAPKVAEGASVTAAAMG
jgi:hypothetical protein